MSALWSRDAAGLCMLIALVAFSVGVVFHVAGCSPSQKSLTVASLDRAHLIIENAHLQASLECIKVHGKDRPAKVEACWIMVDDEFQVHWDHYDKAKRALELGEAAEPIYCEIAQAVPKLPTEVCDGDQ
jgi:hypothetical protein